MYFFKKYQYFCHLKLEIALAIPASNDEKYHRNNSAGQGLRFTGHAVNSLLVTGLMPNARYDQMIEAFGGRGYYALTRGQLKESLTTALSKREPSLLNVMISPHSGKKQQVMTC